MKVNTQAAAISEENRANSVEFVDGGYVPPRCRECVLDDIVRGSYPR
jgi:hypothetical protein